ncbi:MAG TPA: GyrI-like domain-containing protein [Candidatus Kapabacteria bacterium]|nr:GyrI-like domain-containing protein [Candidatus Kapabacteria bacterium]
MLEKTVQIQMSPKIKLIGKRLAMTFADNKTRELWQSFIPRRNEVANAISTNFVSMQIYPAGFFSQFDLNVSFEKWAAKEVTEVASIPEGMESFIIPSGLYAVFHYKGAPAAAGPDFQYIHREWLPKSEYLLDDRPHFEILTDKYKNDDPDSEEDIWIPIKPR